MHSSSNWKVFWDLFFRKRVFLYLLIGVGIIFLTFLTDDNALEIAISGIASVFIGIGVNNFSTLETHDRDEKKLKSKIRHAVKTFEFTKRRLNHLLEHRSDFSQTDLLHEKKELENLIDLTIEMIAEEDLPLTDTSK